jgi:phosphonate degradation associated HDIG domain protein
MPRTTGIFQELASIYLDRGAAAYFGEPVTVTEHSLQAAHFAQKFNAADALVLAALLHDVGHLIGNASNDIADWKIDMRHEVSGSKWLSLRFGPSVSEPVRLHVPAKRYLCATDPAYFGKLSPASVVTLRLQGGPMSEAEVRAFEAEHFFREAVLLRRCDEEAKVAGLATPDFSHYRPLIESLAVERA